MMRKKSKTIVIIAAFIIALAMNTKVAAAKTYNIKIDLKGNGTEVKRPAALNKAKKVKIKSSKKSVAVAKYKKNRKDRRIEFQAKKTGTATITVTCYLKNKKTKTYKYKLKVVKSKSVTALDKSKKAFEIQNQYRKDKGKAELEWSDELYQFCLYRLNQSGFDHHDNLVKDTQEYFGLYAKFRVLLFAENLYSGYSDPKKAMEAWKKSQGHYQNLLDEEHKCGAIACKDSIWCAIFYDGDKADIENFRDYKLKEITVKRLDSKTGAYVGGCSFAYYEEGNKQDTLKVGTVADTAGKTICLEMGKTYVFYERKAPEGCEKAKQVKITVTEDNAGEVVLAD